MELDGLPWAGARLAPNGFDFGYILGGPATQPHQVGLDVGRFCNYFLDENLVPKPSLQKGRLEDFEDFDCRYDFFFVLGGGAKKNK